METAQYVAISEDTDLRRYIALQNLRLQRMAEQLARVQRHKYRKVSAATSLTQGDDSLDVDTTGGNITVSLPAAATCPGKQFHVKKLVAANTLTLDAAGTDLIDGAGTLAWTTQYQSYLVESVLATAPATYGWRVR